jgi:alpha-1,6-mannosyltransferase
MRLENKYISCLSFSIFLAGVVALGFYFPRTNFTATYSIFLVLFGVWILLSKSAMDFKSLFAIGLIARVILIFSSPELSDDYVRFLWDGKLLSSGINPYTCLPTEEIKFLDDEYSNLFPFLNSPNYYTVYPPIIQFINWISVSLGGSITGAIMVMKCIFLAFEILLFYALQLILKEQKRKAFWYWLCPLVILEFSGNLHHEVLMIAFLLLSIYFFQKEKIIPCALFLSLAIATKLSPLLFLPFFFLSIKSSSRWMFLVLCFGFTSLFLSPLVYQNGHLFFYKSIQLYFSSFEFNSSFFKITQLISWSFPYSLILFKIITLATMALFFLFWKKKKLNLLAGLIWIQTIFILSSQSIHPWYLMPLFALTIANNKVPTYIIAWIVLIPLTYITYQFSPYTQQIWVNGLEYGLVFILFILERKGVFKNPFEEVRTQIKV